MVQVVVTKAGYSSKKIITLIYEVLKLRQGDSFVKVIERHSILCTSEHVPSGGYSVKFVKISFRCRALFDPWFVSIVIEFRRLHLSSEMLCFCTFRYFSTISSVTIIGSPDNL
jgi:hypothetical protein